MELLSNISFLAFWLLAAVAVICSLAMIFNPNLVRAGFTLIGAFVAIAGLYFTLSANFVAISQILIYAVGITLVIVFAVMLCSLQDTAADVPNHELEHSLIPRKILAFILSGGLFAMLTFIINTQDWAILARFSGAEAHQEQIAEMLPHYTGKIGSLMLSTYILPFELVSVLLLVVLVGVIILSKKHIEAEKETK